VDADGIYQGTISKSILLEAFDERGDIDGK